MKNLIFKILFFIVVRISSCIFILKLLPKYDQRLFTFTDLGEYNQIESGLQSLNPLYVLLVKNIGYSVENLYDFKWIFISLFLSVIFTIPWIILANKILKNNIAFIYSFILGIHPYLSLYSLKIETGVFAILPVSLIVISRLWPSSIMNKFSLLSSSFLSLFRNALIPMAWSQVIYGLIFKKRTNKEIIFFISIFILCFSSVIQIPYGMKYMSQEFGCYSLSSIENWLVLKGISSSLASFFSFIITPIIHFLLDMGAREAISFYCLSLPKNIAANQLINYFSTFGFLFIHLYCFIRLIRFCFVNKENNIFEILLPFAMLAPTFYGAAHLRYLIPLIPFLLLMGCFPINKKIDLQLDIKKK